MVVVLATTTREPPLLPTLKAHIINTKMSPINHTLELKPNLEVNSPIKMSILREAENMTEKNNIDTTLMMKIMLIKKKERLRNTHSPESKLNIKLATSTHSKLQIC